MKRLLFWVSIVGSVLLLTTVGHGQIKKLLKKIPTEIPGLSEILKSEPSLTTSITDAVTEVPFLDDFNPEQALPMTDLPRTAEGGFVLNLPGFFIFNCQSYCLKAGTYAPDDNRGGSGYLYAPLKGPRANIVRHVLHASYSHPEIPQRDIQVLLWAIIARTKISRMPRAMQLTAALLLTKEEILNLEGGALGLVPNSLINKAFANTPPLVRQTLEAEARLRNMLAQASTTYEELEQVAVLRGDPPSHEEDRGVIWGRWSFHPDGYFIRYFPSSYNQTQIELYVPETIQIERDALERITSIADEAGNRFEAEYADTEGVISDPDHPGLRGFTFRSLRLVNRKLIHPEKVSKEQTEWKDIGWTLVGIPSDEPAAAMTSDSAYNLQERLARSKKHNEELTHLMAGLKIMEGLAEAPQLSQEQWEHLTNLDHLAQAISDAAQVNDSESREMANNYLNLAKKAWMSMVADSLGTNPNPMTFDPASDPVPGSAGRQRIGDSGRPAQNNECANLENAIQNAAYWLEKHADASCMDASDVDEAVKNVDDGADFEVDAYVHSGTCELVVDGKRGASFQEFKEYLMRHGYCSACADAVIAHEREHMRQCHNQDGQEGRPDFGRPSPAQFCRNELEAYCTELKSLIDSLKAAGCQPSPDLAAKIAAALAKCR